MHSDFGTTSHTNPFYLLHLSIMENTTPSPAHTEGPWRFEELRHNDRGHKFSEFQIHNGHKVVAVTSRHTQGTESFRQCVYDARLIAAAPELLEAVKMAKEHCERLPGDAKTECLVSAIDQALAKALST